MKFKKDKVNEKTLEETLSQKEKRLEKMQYTSVIMLIIALTAFFVGLKYMDTIYKTYSLMNNSTIYDGILNRDNENDTLEETQKLMNEIENIYESSYVNEIERENIDEYVLNALISSYGDRYAVYRDPADTIDSSTAQASQINGIGILSRAEYNEHNTLYDIYIIDVYDNSPAEEAGLKIGDIIHKVNGIQLDSSKFNFSEAISNIKGNTGTTVMLTIEDGDTGEIKDVEVERKITAVNTVRYQQINDNVGYIEIRTFESTTADEFKEAIDYFSSIGISKFVFDMRDNTGGLKYSVINTLDMLVGSGVLMYELDSNGNIVETSMSDANCIDFESVTIINCNTASAAELFTKCLSDYELTTTIGETSFGKGTVCTTYPLSNGGSVMISTGKYLTKSMEDIEKIGIIPDIEIKLSDDKLDEVYKLPIEDDDIIQRAIEELEQTSEIKN